MRQARLLSVGTDGGGYIIYYVPIKMISLSTARSRSILAILELAVTKRAAAAAWKGLVQALEGNSRRISATEGVHTSSLGSVGSYREGPYRVEIKSTPIKFDFLTQALSG